MLKFGCRNQFVFDETKLIHEPFHINQVTVVIDYDFYPISLHNAVC